MGGGLWVIGIGRRGESVVSEALTAPVFRLSAHKKDQESERQAALAKLG